MSYNPNPTATVSRKVARNYVNGSGSTMVLGQPCATLSNGNVTTVNVASQASVDQFVGLYNQSTPSTSSGLVIDCGILENITGYSFSTGSPIYIDTTGNLTSIQPVVGVNGFAAGMYCIFVGVIVKNEFNPLNQDLKILIQKAGIL